MKKLINDPQNVPAEFLAGLALAHADILRVCFDPVYVVRVDAPVPGKTGIVSGGGSGHEPMHVGYVGRGMLDAACPGARCSRLRLLIKSKPPRAPSTAERAFSTSSRTTPATS